MISGIFYPSLVNSENDAQSIVYYVPNSGRLLCSCVNTDEKYKFIS